MLDGADLSADQFSEMISDVNYHASTNEGILCFWDLAGLKSLTLQQAKAMDLNPRTQVTLGNG